MAPTFLTPAVRVREITPVTTRADERAVVWMQGEHDAATADALTATLARAGSAGAAGLDLVVDMSGVEFLGAATVGVLLDARRRLALQSRSMTLRAPSTIASRVLGLCSVPTST